MNANSNRRRDGWMRTALHLCPARSAKVDSFPFARGPTRKAAVRKRAGDCRGEFQESVTMTIEDKSN